MNIQKTEAKMAILRTITEARGATKHEAEVAARLHRTLELKLFDMFFGFTPRNGDESDDRQRTR
jgi:hypothetical protein